jgi:hypothetical protein
MWQDLPPYVPSSARIQATRRYAIVGSKLTGSMIVFMVILAVLITAGVRGEIPRKINYQGKITDQESGGPLVGSCSMVFRIYDQADGGSQLWSESRTVEADSAGIFSVILGEATPVNLSFEDPVWLEVEVGGEALSPRREIVSVPFAFHAITAATAASCDSLGGVASDSVWTSMNDGEYSGLDADRVDGLDAAAFSDSGHVHDFRYVHRESLATAGLVNNGSNPVDWTRIKGIPAGLADGVDDVGGSGDGHSLDAADGSPLDAVYVDNEGFVGIGTASPQERLHLTGAEARILIEGAASDPEVQLAATTDQPSEVWKIYKDRGTGELRFAQDGDRLAIRMDTGNVGVGTAAGGEKLIVGGNIDLTGHLKMNSHTVLSFEGTANTFVGPGAGINNVTSGTTGTSNTFVGEASGWANTLGMENVFVGDSTGYSNSQGFYNVFVGHAAGFSNSDGQDNVFVGALAGLNNQDGHWNTFLGSHAGRNNSGGTSNTSVGSGAGAGIVGGSDNTFVGQGAGHGIVSGSGNVCLGNFAGQSADGTGNVYIGHMAGLGLDEGGSNKLCIANGPESTDVLIFGDFSTGDLGLGTRQPACRLQVSSPTSNFGMLRIENSNTGDNEASIGFRPGRDATGADMWVAGYGAWSTNGFVIGKEAPLFVVDPDGDVGIGVENPALRLEVEQPSSCWIQAKADGGVGIAGLALENDNGSWEIDCRGDMFDVLAFIRPGGMSVDPAVVIEPGGDVGIGVDNPERKLHLKGDAPRVLVESASAGSPEVNFKHSGDPASDIWAIYKHGDSDDLRFYQNGNKVWFKGGSGNMGLGGDPGGYRLYVNGSACGTSMYSVCSDRSLKRDIQGIEAALDKVISLEGVSFLWRTDEYEERNLDSGRHYGLIAQDVEEVLPEVVSEGGGGERAVAYAEIIPVLIEAIKAQQGRIEVLEERLAELETQKTGSR